MAIITSYPGVYVQEIPSGVRTIAGVSTSITLFMGATARGPVGRPLRCFNFSDFSRNFGDDSATGDMARQAKLFFLNGGTDCYVMRLAQGANPSSVTLQTPAGAPALILTARQAGRSGASLRAKVTYDAALPETAFNLELWIAQPQPGGPTLRAEVEVYRNLSMDPASPLYAPTLLTQRSKLVSAALPGGAPASAAGFSQAARPLPFTAGAGGAEDLRNRLTALFSDHGQLRLKVGGIGPVEVNLAGVNSLALTAGQLTDHNTVLAAYRSRLKTAIDTLFGSSGPRVQVSFENGPAPPAAEGDASCWLRITADAATHDVQVLPASDRADIATYLLMGVDQGGLEVGAYAGRRPAANGIALNPLGSNYASLVGAPQNAVTALQLPERQANGSYANVSIPVDLVFTTGTDPLYRASAIAFPNENADGFRRALGVMRDAINAYRDAHAETFPWSASVVGLRLLVQADGADDDLLLGALASSPTLNLATVATANSRHSLLGAGGTAGLQTPGAAGFDGNPPTLAEYEAALEVVDREVDLFNLMVLPPAAGSSLDMATVYRPASAFCQRRRAFLLMDSPLDWESAQDATSGVSALKTGLVKDHCAIYHPRLQINEGGLNHFVGASGAMAGMMARIDGARGVWKAPAGIEADIRGISGIEYPYSDMENGIQNLRAINGIRRFPTGVVAWGARTMDGDENSGSEYKYIPVRRLALYIEESLYRGLRWAVFEPNDEPLWALIRLNVGAFMHGLFRQGAFQGQVKKDAYFVKCDSETTNATDQNLGRVNIWVGFAPLKPAEYVVLYLQQIAGQIET
jgi:phage tail sheath protein FI